MKRLTIITLCIITAMSMFAEGISHTVKKNETLYGIAYKYGITIDRLIELNPNADNGVRPGMVLIITPDDAADNNVQPAVEEAKADEPKVTAPKNEMTYTTVAGDTFASVAAEYSLTIDELIDLNPFADPNYLVEGTILRLSEEAPVVFNEPAKRKLKDPKVEIEKILPPTTVDEDEDTIEDDLEIPTLTDIEPRSEKTILIVLPFMTADDNPGKQALHYTEFYKGFLIAANEMSDQPGTHIRVVALDTNNSATTAKLQVQNTISAEIVDAIIAPAEEEQLRAIAELGDEYGIPVINLFSIRDTLQNAHPAVIQANINQAIMYDKAISAIMSRYGEYTPVIVSREGGRNEKQTFTTALRERYAAAERPVVDVKFEGSLFDEDLESLDPETKYVFIPESGTLAEFNKFISPVIQLRENSEDPERVQILGYPDWTAFKNEPRELLHAANVTVFSRFLINDRDLNARRVGEEFTRWYGETMTESIPNQAILGYDACKMLITHLRESDGSFDDAIYDGLQSSFDFERVGEDGGLINTALYFINYSPDGSCEATIE